MEELSIPRAGFTDAAKLNRREIDTAGDAVTIPQTAATLSKALAPTIEFVQISIEEVRKNSVDFADNAGRSAPTDLMRAPGGGSEPGADHLC